MEFDLVMQLILEHVFTSRLAFFRTTSGLVYIYEDVYNSPISSSMSEVTYFMFFAFDVIDPNLSI